MPYLRLLRQDRRQIPALPYSFGLRDVRARLLQIINKARDQVVPQRHVLLLPSPKLDRQLHAVAVLDEFVGALLPHVVVAFPNFVGHFYFLDFVRFRLFSLLFLHSCSQGGFIITAVCRPELLEEFTEAPQASLMPCHRLHSTKQGIPNTERSNEPLSPTCCFR